MRTSSCGSFRRAKDLICWQQCCSPQARSVTRHMPPIRSRHKTDAPTILVIDDDMDARRMYSEYLRANGCTAFTAADGRTGIDKTNDLCPDVVVLDLAMPRVD